MQENKKIEKVYCVYDGIKPDVALDSRFSKVESYSTAKRLGPAEARNIGLNEGFGKGHSDALLIDCDVKMEEENLNQLIKSFSKKPSAIACPLVRSLGSTWLDHYHNLSGTLNGRYLKTSNEMNLLFGTTSCMFIPKKIWDNKIMFCPDFSEAAGEDIDFCLRVIFAGFQIAALNVNVLHWYGYNGNDKHDWTSFLSRFERYGRGERLLTIKHPYHHFLIGQTIERLNWE